MFLYVLIIVYLILKEKRRKKKKALEDKVHVAGVAKWVTCGRTVATVMGSGLTSTHITFS